MADSNRILWIDTAKVLVMCLVIFNHLGVENEGVRTWVSSFHVPAFFVLSGIFASTKGTWGEALKKDFFRLLLPVILWHLIGAFTWAPVQARILNGENFIEAFCRSQWQFLTGDSWDFGWFMLALFCIRIVYRLLSRTPLVLQVVVGLGALPLAAWWLRDCGHLPFFVLSSLMAYPFYFMGKLGKEIFLSEKHRIINGITPPFHSL